MVGGLLMTVAAVGTFLAWQQAVNGSDATYVVAARAIPPGQRLAPEDLRVVPMSLDDDVSSAAFTELDAVVGRVSLGPIGAGELVQAAQVSDPSPQEDGSLVEVSFALPPDRAVDGRLRSGDRVDVFVTEDGRTRAVLEGVTVVAASGAAHSSVLPGGEVMVTIGLDHAADRVGLIHAVRVGEVTLVRSTHAGGAGVHGIRTGSLPASSGGLVH